MKHLSGGQLAGGNSATEKAENDFYATDPDTVDTFMKRALSDGLFNDMHGHIVWECACGDGNIAHKMKQYFPQSPLLATDLVYRGYGEGGIDFLTANKSARMIITNPPFSLINDFIRHGLEQTDRYLVLFAKIQLLETVERKKILEKSPLRYIYMYILQDSLLGRMVKAETRKARNGRLQCSLLGLFGTKRMAVSL